MHNQVQNLVRDPDELLIGMVRPVPDTDQVLVPLMELHGHRDLINPELNDVKVVAKVNMLFLITNNP